MLIVLEGCDGVGKTTIARNLASVLDARIIHCTAKTPNDYEFFKGIIDASKYQNIIADRFCYGQFVYQEANERKLTPGELVRLELAMIEAGAKVIHVHAPVSEVEQRLRYRNEKTDLPVAEIMDKFIDVFEHSLEKPMLWWTGSEI